MAVQTPVDRLIERIMDEIRFAAPRDAVEALERALIIVRTAKAEYERGLGA